MKNQSVNRWYSSQNPFPLFMDFEFRIHVYIREREHAVRGPRLGAYFENVFDILVEPVAALLQTVDVIGQREISNRWHEFLAGFCHLAKIAGLLHRCRAELLAKVSGRP